MAAIEVSVTPAPLSPDRYLADLAGTDPDCGAVASFLGQVRTAPGLEALELEHYPGVTEKALDRIARHAAERWSCSQAVIIHRVGRMEIGEPIVWVAASAPHRHDAINAATFMIDTLKTQAPFWKREHTTQGSHWVDARTSDDEAAARWLDTQDKENA